MRRRAFPTLVLPRSERELCDMLRGAVSGFATAYPEQGDWDLLLVMRDGLQVGIQAKLRTNLEVVAQTLRIGGHTDRGTNEHAQRYRPVTLARPVGPGPDIRAVLVVATTEALDVVAAQSQVLVIEQADLGARPKHHRQSSLEEQILAAPRWPTTSRVWVPPFVPDNPAGVPSPRTVSPWKVNAARLCADLRAGLTPSCKEVEARVGSFSRWRLWLDRVPGTKPARYRVTDPQKLPDMEFPDVARGLGLPWWDWHARKWVVPASGVMIPA